MIVTSTGVVQLTTAELASSRARRNISDLSFHFECTETGLNLPPGRLDARHMNPGTVLPKAVKWANISEQAARGRITTNSSERSYVGGQSYRYEWDCEAITLSGNFIVLRGSQGAPFLLLRHQMTDARRRNVVGSTGASIREADGTLLQAECLAFAELRPDCARGGTFSDIQNEGAVGEMYTEMVEQARQEREQQAGVLRDRAFEREHRNRQRTAARRTGRSLAESLGSDYAEVMDNLSPAERVALHDRLVADINGEGQRQPEPDVEEIPRRRMRR